MNWLLLSTLEESNKYFVSENDIVVSEYFNFGLSVDCVVFGYQAGEVRVLLIERGAEPYKGSWALPGDLVDMDTDLKESAVRCYRI